MTRSDDPVGRRGAMTLGVTQWTLDVGGVATVARAAALGFACLQLDSGGWSGWPETLDAATRDDYLRAARDSGVRLVGIGVNALNEHSLLGPAGSSGRRRAIGSVRRAIETARHLDIPLVYLPSFGASEMKSVEDIDITAEIVADLAAYGAEHGVEVASENTLDAAGQLRLLERANHANLTLLMDSYNPVVWGHDVPTLIRQLENRLCAQMHLKDGRGGVMGSALLGEGDADFFRTAATLGELSPTPLFVLENDYGVHARERVAKDLATLLEALGP